MSYKYEQTNAAKEGFQSEILDYLRQEPNEFISKKELMTVFDMNERAVRKELEKIANYYPIRATAGRKGYALIEWNDEMPVEELRKIRDELNLQIAELHHRVLSLNARLKPLIANVEVIEKVIGEDYE